MIASKHPRQDERLRVLRSFDILDTPREADFDEVVAFASGLCGTPISVVNLIDAERQWFKAEVGLGVRETPLDTSLCSHAILEHDFMEIGDTLLDPRMADNPLCHGESGLRFYAGALLQTGEGLPLGTLCVLDTEPRDLTDLQRDGLRVLARQVMRQIELRRALRHGEALRREIDHRVKNSLQSVASMVRMEERSNPAAAPALRAVQQRITAIATIHEALQVSGDEMRADIAALIEAIAGSLRETVPPGVTIETRCDGVLLEADMAVAIGTLVNEFVANSAKHAFGDGRTGHVVIDFSREGDELRLACADHVDASARSPGNAPASPSGTGLGRRIMAAMASRLNGTLEDGPTGNGYRMTVTFDVPPADRPAD